MHREFRKLLEKATGTQEHVIAVNIDIRGFSAFCKEVESADVALYVKRVYRRLINEFSSIASFFKPTGDGLLVIIPYTDDNVEKIASNTLRNCLRVLEKFSSFFVDDRNIYFGIPERVGIGISRGNVCRLVSGDKTLDYSGRPLNIASRLMNVARPMGVVFDETFTKALSDKLKAHFSKGRVYLHGIAESKPIAVYYSKKYMKKIDPTFTQRLDTHEWKPRKTDPIKLSQIKKQDRFFYTLPSRPADPLQIAVDVILPISMSREYGGDMYSFSLYKYQFEAGKHRIYLNFKKLAKILTNLGAKNEDAFRFEIRYPEFER